jgi:hypothetical protein
MSTLIGKLDELKTGIVGTVEQGQAKMMSEMRQQPTRPGAVDLTEGPKRASTGYGNTEPNPN